jgi:chromosome segregation ATPase
MSNNLTENPNDSLGDKVDRLITIVQSMDSRLGELETRVDRRLRETQPVWEDVQVQLTGIREQLQSLEESFQRLEESHQRLEESHRRLEESHRRLEESHQSLVEDVRSLRAEVASLRADTEKGFRTVDRRMERQIGEFEKRHAYQRDLEERVDKLEKLSTP